MRLKTIISASLITVIAFGGFAKSPKRGVSENEFQFKAQVAAISPGVSWYYNWGPSVGRYLKNETGMEFVPMCWNGNYDAEAIRTYVGEHPEVKYLLGFNEPNFSNQANMTPAQAAAKWGDVRALAAQLGLELVAPALNYSPNPPYQDPGEMDGRIRHARRNGRIRLHGRTQLWRNRSDERTRHHIS